ncbi:MAG: DMT family transporter, partial [Pseudomonadota bacterium]
MRSEPILPNGLARHPLANNSACFSAMAIWAIGFPLAEILLQSWGTFALVAVRQILTVAMLLAIWCARDGWHALKVAPWLRGLGVGGLGFGVGAVLLLMGQYYSDPVTPALTVATMPIAGAIIEVLFDSRRLTLRLCVGIGFALIGGWLATGVALADGEIGIGVLLCLAAVVLFAWGTRATTREFPTLSTLGQTTITLNG